MGTTMGSTFAEIATAVGAASTVGLFLAACVAGRIASRQLRGLKEQVSDGRAAEGRRRVFEHLGQLFDGEFVEMETEATRLFGAKPAPPDAAAWATLWSQKSDVQKSRIMAVMNFYEVVAGEYNDPTGELLDRKTADKALSYIADAMWLRAAPFVAWLRDDFKEQRAYAEWEQLHVTFTQTQGTGS
jgi:hypothetical protein